MYLVELGRQIFIDMRIHKIRSFLALFGIVWGTVSVVVLLALGQGFYDYNKKSMESLASGALLIFPGSTSLPYFGLPQGQRISFRVKDMPGLASYSKDIDKMTFELRLQTPIGHKQVQVTRHVIGVNANYSELQKLSLMQGGRFINPLDIEKRSRVAVIGEELKRILFGDKNAIDQIITIADVPFRVIGVLTRRETSISFGDPRSSFSAFVPFTTFQVIWGIDASVSKIVVLPIDQSKSDKVKKSISYYFAAKYHFDPEDPQAVFIPDVNQFLQFFTLFFRAIQGFLGFCGVMTLGVGGVGVANIMFLIVSERTREIGLRIALGARDYHIMLQILLEALLIVIIGGILGFSLSWLIVSLLQSITLPGWIGVPVISYGSMAMTILILAFVGICVGIFPARRAAKMEPVTALAF